MLWTTPLDFISSGLFEKDHTIGKKHRSRSRDREKLQGLKSPAGSEPGKGKGKGPGVKKVPNKAASGKTVMQTKTKGMWHEMKTKSAKIYTELSPAISNTGCHINVYQIHLK